jgi:putative SOS response-associated peptidase YedK
MPVIVAPERFALWLGAGPPTDAFAALFEPFPADRMEAFPVSRKVNSPANDVPEILEPLSS